MIMGLLVNFIITFLFALGVLMITSTIIAIVIKSKYLPELKLIFLYNTISALMVVSSLFLMSHYLPIAYRDVKVNSGIILLKSSGFNERVIIKENKDELIYKMCGKEYRIKNRLDIFYNSVSKNLIHCGLDKNEIVNIEIQDNPFLDLYNKFSNSIILYYSN